MDEIRDIKSDPKPGGVIAEEEIRAALAKILASRTFQAARGQSKFLAYTVTESIAGRGPLLKEHLIGLEALGRGDSFDPRLDPIVRTQARKLRLRLAKYYETEGALDPIRIDYRKGSYAPVFQTPPALPGEAAATGETAVTHNAENNARPDASPEEATPPVPLPSGIRPAAALDSPRRFRSNSAALVISAGVLILAIQVAVYGWLRREPAAQPNAGASIAVLPFVNLSEKPGDELLSDGLTDELMTAFEQVPNVQLAGRESLRFKGRNADVRQVARELRVHAVLMGSVRKSGDRLRVTAQLNDGARGTHLWSGSYNCSLDEARSIPPEISSAVTSVLGLSIASRNETAASRVTSPMPNADAYEDYLRGLHFWGRLNAESLNVATEYFKKAIAEDPSFAHAYAALAQCYAASPLVASIPPLEVVSKIKVAANKALSLDSRLDQAHFDLAMAAEYEFDWVTADKEYQTGLALNPKSVVGHLWYAKYLALTGRIPELFQQRTIAAKLDPVSAYAVQAVGGYYSVMGATRKPSGSSRRHSIWIRISGWPTKAWVWPTHCRAPARKLSTSWSWPEN